MANSSSSYGNYNISYELNVVDAYSKPLEKFTKDIEKAQKKAEDVTQKAALVAEKATQQVEKAQEKASRASQKAGREADRATKKIEQSTAQMTINTGNHLVSFGKTVSAAVSLPLAAFTMLSLHSAAALEKVKTSLQAFTGSAEKANALVEKIKDISHSSTFNMQEIADASRMLLGMGYSAEQVTEQIKSLSDVSVTFGLPLENLTNQMAFIKEQKFLDQRTVRMLSRQGIPVMRELDKYITKVTGKKFSLKQIEKFLEEGRLSAKAFEGIFKQMSSEGGVAFRGMEKHTATLGGSFLRLKNAAGGFLEEFGEIINNSGKVGERVDLFASKVQDFTKHFRQWADENPKAVEQLTKLGAILITLPPVLYAIGKAFLVTGAMMKAHPLILGLTAAALAISYILDNQDKIAAFAKKHRDIIPSADTIIRQQNDLDEKYEKLEFKRESPSVAAAQNAQAGSAMKSESVVDINIKDPGGNVQSVQTTTVGFTKLNLGTNNAPALAR